MAIKVLTIFGTRPEAIKMAPVIKVLSNDKNNFEVKVCVTAQHRQMLDTVLQTFEIIPDYDLDIMKEFQSLSDITCRALKGLEKIINDEKPDIVLVHGDTTTTFAGALAGFYNKTKVGHVEAGLRTFNKFEPFPEEINRCLVGRLADIHFAPTQAAKINLMNESVDEKNIFVTGNTAIDCVKFTVKENCKFENDFLNRIDYDNKKVVVITAHRRENWGAPLERICMAIRELSSNKELEFIYAVHPNPTVKNTAEKFLSGIENVHLLEPLNISDMHNLFAKSFLVMTDSGGIQEEAPAFNKPVLVLRDVTERSEGLKTGALKLLGTDTENIVRSVKKLIYDSSEYNFMTNAKNPFGDGSAAERIKDAILFYFGKGNRPDDFIS